MREFIYSAEPGLLIGFHGCEQSVCDEIISGEKQMKASNNAWDWLADGRYFWQNNYERAWYYANHPPGNLKIKKPAVLGGALYNGAGFRERTHIQIAIRNPNMIKGYFLPRRETKWAGAPIPLLRKSASL
jgi:hypothetical protein